MNPTVQRTSSTRLVPAVRDPDSSSSVRPRARRLANSAAADLDGFPARSSASLLSSPSPSPSRGASPIPSERIGSVTGRNDRSESRSAVSARGRTAASSSGGGLLDVSWASGWASVQGLATSLLAGGDDAVGGGGGGAETARGRNGSSSRASTRGGNAAAGGSGVWGPEPPKKWSSSRVEDLAAGSRAEREAALRAMRTASVLESHEDARNGLDASARFKKRRSDEDMRRSSQPDPPEEQLVYIHHVRPDDTYARIVLKYRCREDAFRKANGLWSRDNIQVRKWLAIPVDACEVRGRPCDGPSASGGSADLLSLTPDPVAESSGNRTQGSQGPPDDFFAAASSSSRPAHQTRSEAEDTPPWTHLRWVAIDSFPAPVEIARVSRGSLGYFPPRRKKTLRSTSALSSPRESLDALGTAPSSDLVGSPESSSSRRRHSSLSGGQPVALAYGSSTPTSSRSRVNSGGDDHRPAWMRRPGGVGSMGRNVHAPGPAKDYLNSWAKKHAPSLNIDSFPSMSVMGSEIARFAISGNDQPSIVESPFEDGRDVSANNRQGLGLDKAAAAVETWLRGAFAKRPGTPSSGPRGQPAVQPPGDLIELTDTNSDDGRGGGGGSGGGGLAAGVPMFPDLNLLQGSHSDGGGLGRNMRGRSPGAAAGKMDKAD